MTVPNAAPPRRALRALCAGLPSAPMALLVSAYASAGAARHHTALPALHGAAQAAPCQARPVPCEAAP